MCHSQKTDKMAISVLAELTWGVGMAENKKKRRQPQPSALSIINLKLLFSCELEISAKVVGIFAKLFLDTK